MNLQSDAVTLNLLLNISARSPPSAQPIAKPRTLNPKPPGFCRTPEEFSQCLHTAMASEPTPLTQQELQKLTWDAATDRFLNVAEVSKAPEMVESVVDNVLHAAHNVLTGEQ